jgi:hypothetical protein
MGVFPVPPTARLPTQIRGKLNAADFKIFLSNNQLRSQIIAPYTNEKGKSKYLKLLSKIVLL